MDRIKGLRQKEESGDFSVFIPFGVDDINIDISNIDITSSFGEDEFWEDCYITSGTTAATAFNKHNILVQQIEQFIDFIFPKDEYIDD